MPTMTCDAAVRGPTESLNNWYQRCNKNPIYEDDLCFDHWEQQEIFKSELMVQHPDLFRGRDYTPQITRWSMLVEHGLTKRPQWAAPEMTPLEVVSISMDIPKRTARIEI